MAKWRAALLMVAILTLLAGCDLFPDEKKSDAASHRPPVAVKRPDLAQAPKSRPNTARRAARAKAAESAAITARNAETDQSREMREYLAGIEQVLIQNGLLRLDYAPKDIPVTAQTLTQNFINIALFDEYTRDGDNLVARTVPARLRRWQVPVNMVIEFGDSVAPATRIRDRAQIRTIAARLARTSGHPVNLVKGSGNFTILILNEDERRNIGSRLKQLVPGIPAADIHAIQDLSPRNYCTVFAYSRGNSPVYSQAVAMIRSELPPRLRTSCIHEELAQGMGLANDSPQATPSIFNDDEEFAYLTEHDELLLRILYDPRLEPGMNAEQALPIVQHIAAELRPALTN